MDQSQFLSGQSKTRANGNPRSLPATAEFQLRAHTEEILGYIFARRLRASSTIGSWASLTFIATKLR
jgi:hypothetical protein